MSSVGSAVGVDGIIGVAVVGDDDSLVAGSLCCLDDLADALIDGFHSSLDGFVNTRMSHHIAIGEVHHDEVVLVLLDGFDEFVLHLVSAHLGLEVVGCHLRTCDEDALLAFVGSLSATVEEEGHVCVLLRLGCVELLQALAADVFAEGVLYVLLWEEDVHACETCVVRRHAVVLQAGNGLHSLLDHVLLSQHDGEFLSAVVAVVEEDDDVALLDSAIDGAVVDGLDELVGDAFVVTLLHSLDEVLCLLTLAADEQVVGNLHAFPTLVAVHCIEATDDAGNHSVACLVALVDELLDKADATLRVGVTTIHEAVHESLLYAVFLTNLDEFEEVVERTVYAAVRGQTHQVNVLSISLRVLVSADDFRVLHDAAVCTSAVDLHEVLIDDATSTDVEVTDLRVTHLSVGQTDVLTACQELAVRIGSIQFVEIRSRCVEDDISLAMSADAPAVENHQKSFLCHNSIFFIVCLFLYCGCKDTKRKAKFKINYIYFRF